MTKTDLSQQVKTQHSEDHDPQRQEYFPVEPLPVIREVNIAQELQRECEFQKTQRYLNAVEPAALFWQCGHPGR